MLNTGTIPGNRNADNIDEKLRDFEYILFLSRTIQTTGVKAALLKSFGFGQVGGEALVINPHYLYCLLTPEDLEKYKEKRSKRHVKTFRYLHDVLVGKHSMVQVKEQPPYSSEIESQVYLNPASRAENDCNGSWSFTRKAIQNASKDALSPSDLKPLLFSLLKEQPAKGVGIDVQLINEINVANDDFIDRNFTTAEQTYCRGQPDQNASFAGRWAAKEAVIKAICTLSKEKPAWIQGSAGALKQIEILSQDGVPKVHLSSTLNLADKAEIKVSISHSGNYAVAIAFAAVE